MHKWLRRWFATEMFPDVRRTDLDRVDERLTDLEREQRQIELRLALLERQADPRGIRESYGG